MNKGFVDYIKKADILDEKVDIDFSDKAFAYDYNEVQELFFDYTQNNYVILAGETNLRKKDMLGRICQDLVSRGVEKEDMLYLDYELPILHNENVLSIISDFCKDRKESFQLYLILNEAQECGDCITLLKEIRSNFSNVKVLLSSSTPTYFFEQIYDQKLDYIKIVVLSRKNPSNIKYESQRFGVYQEFKYNVKNGVVEIKGMTKEGKAMSSHIVPSEIGGIPVKIIASGAFHDRKEMTSIELPDSIEMIGDYAFSKCCNLEEIRLPKALTFIGEHSFLGAKQLRNIFGGDNVTHIGNSAFYDTEWLAIQGDFASIGSTLYKYKGNDATVVIPSEIKQISSYAFADSEVVSVDCSQVSEIGEGTFYRCKQLKSINLKLKNIPSFAFYNCESLNMDFAVDKIGKFGLYSCRNIETISVGKVGICGLAFCHTLKRINGLLFLSTGAAHNCDNLSVINSSEIINVGKFALSKTCLGSLSLSNATSICDYAFYGCQKLKTVLVNQSCHIGKSILFRCENVFNMNISGKYKLSSYFGGLCSRVNDLTVNGDIVDDFCRGNKTLKTLTLNNVAKFGRWSFYGNTSLCNIVINSVAEIGDWAFAYCDGITNIVLPKSIEYIGMNAFRYCHNLQSITIMSESAIHFGANAFYSTSDRKMFYVSKDIAYLYANLSEWREYLNYIVSI